MYEAEVKQSIQITTFCNVLSNRVLLTFDRSDDRKFDITRKLSQFTICGIVTILILLTICAGGGQWNKLISSRRNN
jgi:hypothetical protein